MSPRVREAGYSSAVLTLLFLTGVIERCPNRIPMTVACTRECLSVKSNLGYVVSFVSVLGNGIVSLPGATTKSVLMSAQNVWRPGA